MKLVIAIPALNEEDSIGSVVEQCLAARETITAQTAVTEVEVTVISDGSSDRTVEIAQGYGDAIRLIVFPLNRGYGAAIMEAWQQSDAELMGFLDADGTCDPLFFVELCRELAEQDAHLVLGCRMNSRSQMPFIRRLGNRMFAAMMSLFALARVRDSASGMRVVRRSCLPSLLPLPTGLHFTPAMSARAVMSRDLRIREVDMPYHERAGDSKLNAFTDGLRFLKVILQATLLYRPSRPMGLVASVFFLAALGLCFAEASVFGFALACSGEVGLAPLGLGVEHLEVVEIVVGELRSGDGPALRLALFVEGEVVLLFEEIGAADVAEAREIALLRGLLVGLAREDLGDERGHAICHGGGIRGDLPALLAHDATRGLVLDHEDLELLPHLGHRAGDDHVGGVGLGDPRQAGGAGQAGDVHARWHGLELVHLLEAHGEVDLGGHQAGDVEHLQRVDAGLADEGWDDGRLSHGSGGQPEGQGRGGKDDPGATTHGDLSWARDRWGPSESPHLWSAPRKPRYFIPKILRWRARRLVTAARS